VDIASGGQHVPVLIFGFFALVEFATRPESIFPAALALTPLTTSQHSTKSSKAEDTPNRTSGESWLFSSIALGTLVSSFHDRLSDPSTLLAWSWSGYPDCRTPPTRPCTAHAPRASARNPAGTHTRIPVRRSGDAIVHFQTPEDPHSSSHFCDRRVFDLLVAYTHRMDRLRRRTRACRIPDSHHAFSAAEGRCCCAVAWRWPRVRNGVGTLGSVRVRRHVHRRICFRPRCMELP
jgi:hypothetical protein